MKNSTLIPAFAAAMMLAASPLAFAADSSSKDESTMQDSAGHDAKKDCKEDKEKGVHCKKHHKKHKKHDKKIEPKPITEPVQ